MKKFTILGSLATSLLATQVLAGTLTVNGNLVALSNLTAQSITLGGVTQTAWPSGGSGLPLQGYKYVIVPEGTNDLQRGGNLLAAYATATTLSPSSSNRVAVIVPPGSYNLGSTSLVMNTSYVDLIGLVPAQMTTKQIFTASDGSKRVKTVANVQCSVRILSASPSGTIIQNVDNIRIESMILTNSSGVAYHSEVVGSETVLRHISASSMSPGIEFAGSYGDCVGGPGSFGNGGDASGTFVDCVGGDGSFSGTIDDCCSGVAKGVFLSCTAGNYSFGIDADASGVFVDCVAQDNSFGSFSAFDGSASGYFMRCVAGDDSFGTTYCTGTFVDCVGGSDSFALGGTSKMRHCSAGPGSFGSFNIASDDFNYNVGGTNTFLMLPQLPTSTNGLPSGTVYNSGGTLKIVQ